MNTASKPPLTFRKMHGLGNDFVIIDGRNNAPIPSVEEVRAIGDRHRGVGFDQLVVLHESDEADFDVVFYNSDGSTSGACGNASRCIADLAMAESGRDSALLRTEGGLLRAERAGQLIRVNMGPPVLSWRDVPLARDVDLNALPLDGTPSAVGMGNPHCVFFVEDAEAVDIAVEGARFEHDPLFPERTNVEFVQSLTDGSLRQRTWERGAGETLACGSGACAVAVAAHRRGLTGRDVTIHLDGGDLHLDWRNDGVWMTGGISYAFTGVWPR
ncbi:diaminopimelate epimerase [Pontivivens insulae]|uniref:Diaminopimelate epimerase n=1 Tax=Pontivivens insulae TaxID=1639689 RepID=A0A2R8AAL3_9RHOB|nr:diaminopimelate epimerase [Pontivivens insulae]RED13180.1 diaminopimelate epimerase [Pontivivens insulae]SPF29272.1 Diaminopimelate epimerase [Pontivivens insulae]